MVGQVLRALRRAAGFQVGRRGTDHPGIGGQAPRHQRAVGQVADPDRHVDPLLHQVQEAVGEVHVDHQARMAAQEFRQRGGDGDPPEKCRYRHPQEPRRCRGAGKCGPRLLQVAQDAAGIGQEGLPLWCQGQAPRRPVHQPGPQILFQRGQARAGGGRREVQVPPRLGQAAGMGGSHEQGKIAGLHDAPSDFPERCFAGSANYQLISRSVSQRGWTGEHHDPDPRRLIDEPGSGQDPPVSAARPRCRTAL